MRARVVSFERASKLISNDISHGLIHSIPQKSPAFVTSDCQLTREPIGGMFIKQSQFHRSASKISTWKTSFPLRRRGEKRERGERRRRRRERERQTHAERAAKERLGARFLYHLLRQDVRRRQRGTFLAGANGDSRVRDVGQRGERKSEF